MNRHSRILTNFATNSAMADGPSCTRYIESLDFYSQGRLSPFCRHWSKNASNLLSVSVVTLVQATVALNSRPMSLVPVSNF